MSTQSCRTESVPPALLVRDLSYRYASEPVLSGVSFSLAPGQATFLLGPNGSGKSTLLRCLAGWTQPNQGSLELCGTPFDPRSRTQRQAIAFVPDTPSFYDDLTAYEHLQFVLAANHRPARAEAIDEKLDAFGLLPFKNQYPSSYSRGMRQKLALALAFLLEPQLLLFDEPHGPLDKQAAHLLGDLCNQALERGAALVVSCHHDLPRVSPHLVLHLEEGTLRAESTANASEPLDGQREPAHAQTAAPKAAQRKRDAR